MEADRVAVQCPYSGGKAVYQARWFVKEFINDTLQYDDVNTCLTQGILRIQNSSPEKNETQELNFTIIPNPNKGMFEIQLKGKLNELISIDIFNNYNQLVRKIQTESQKNSYTVDLNKIPGGVYFIRLEAVNGISVTKKLIIVN